jgi:hypothetical protein
MEKFVFFFVSSGGGKNGRGRGRNGTEAKRGGVRKRGESEWTFRGAAAFSGYAPREREREREEGPGSPKVEPVARRLAQPGSLDDLPIIDLEKDRTRDPSAEDDPPKIRVLPSPPASHPTPFPLSPPLGTSPKPKNARNNPHPKKTKGSDPITRDRRGEGRREELPQNTHSPPFPDLPLPK